MMMKSSSLVIERLTLGALDTNCYLAWCPETLAAVIIDPADSGDTISERVLQLQLQPQFIILTHGHFDHVLGLLEVKLNFPVPILLHPADHSLLETAPASAKHWLGRVSDPVPAPDQELTAGQVITFGHQQLIVMETPGHTPGSVSLYNDEIVFSGDTLFKNGVGRTDFSYSKPLQLNQSLHALCNLPGKLTVYPGHGETTSIETERTYLKQQGFMSS